MYKIAVMSGKGGVGKTTIALAIAKALAKKGFKVAIVDCDITGANTHLSLKIKSDFSVKKDTLYPAIVELDGCEIEYISIALISEAYVNWKGEKLEDFIKSVVEKGAWTCDYMVLDTPPGTHEDAKAAMQIADVAILVTMPTKYSELDTRKTLNMLADMKKPIAGVYVNFDSVICPECKKEFKIFNYNVDLRVRIIERVPVVFGVFSIPDLDTEKLLDAIKNPVTVKSKFEKPVGVEVMKRFLILLGKIERKGRVKNE